MKVDQYKLIITDGNNCMIKELVYLGNENVLIKSIRRDFATNKNLFTTITIPRKELEAFMELIK